MIEQIEKFKADLQLRPLAKDMRVLEKRQVRVVDGRASERVASQVAEADILIGCVLNRGYSRRG